MPRYRADGHPDKDNGWSVLELGPGEKFRTVAAPLLRADAELIAEALNLHRPPSENDGAAEHPSPGGGAIVPPFPLPNPKTRST